MATVEVVYKGQCRSVKKQRELCRFLEPLAELSRGLYKPPHHVKRFDGYIEGDILISRSLLKTPLKKLPQGIEILEEKRMDLSPRTLEWEPVTSSYVWLSRVHLYGLEFDLYDPRLVVNENRLSFVFVDHEKLPTLKGKIVLVEDQNECQRYSSLLVRHADWYLCTPSLWLRYLYEQWLDYLLGWVKYFFIPELYFWRRKELSGYDSLKQRLDEEVRKAGNKKHVKINVFNDIVEKFREEAALITKSVEETEEENVSSS